MGTDATETTANLKDFIPIISVMVGVIIGGLISFFTTNYLEIRKQAAESKRIALAFRGEIRALLGIIKRKKYIENFQWVIEQMEITQNKYPMHIQIRREYFLVFQNNVSNIGSLASPLPELIAQFYVQANSVLEELESHRDGTLDNIGIPDLIESVKELRALLQETVAIGEQIIEYIPASPR